MATVRTRGFDQAAKILHAEAVKVARKKGAPEAIKYYRDLLDKNKQSTGKAMPKKSAKTKRAYRKKGYDTDRFLIRSNVSAQIKKRNIKNGVKLFLTKPEVIGYHDPSRVRWFHVNKAVSKIFQKEVQKGLLKKYPRRVAA